MANKHELTALRYLNDYAKALNTDDFQDDDIAENGFLDVIDLVQQPKRDEFITIYGNLKSENKGDVFSAYANAAKQLASLKKEFELGRIKAKKAQSSLFFPALAKDMAAVAASLSAVKKAAEDMLDNLDEAKAAFDSGDVQALFDEAQESKSSLDAILDALSQLKS